MTEAEFANIKDQFDEVNAYYREHLGEEFLDKEIKFAEEDNEAIKLCKGLITDLKQVEVRKIKRIEEEAKQKILALEKKYEQLALQQGTIEIGTTKSTETQNNNILKSGANTMPQNPTKKQKKAQAKEALPLTEQNEKLNLQLKRAKKRNMVTQKAIRTMYVELINTISSSPLADKVSFENILEQAEIANKSTGATPDQAPQKITPAQILESFQKNIQELGKNILNFSERI